ncbi:uncharacterized protein LOC131000877 [Salvia miltiorrhiza]|uniref:uncharacterized protein LOC131000877 n=1 Tax=Salvia miltiorrhiza TaxID=226208 RepID=UPI0025ABE1B5|nr:uncharacterized protein LOC131000877 [Salvia miltiorrhiza]
MATTAEFSGNVSPRTSGASPQQRPPNALSPQKFPHPAALREAEDSSADFRVAAPIASAPTSDRGALNLPLISANFEQHFKPSNGVSKQNFQVNLRSTVDVPAAPVSVNSTEQQNVSYARITAPPTVRQPDLPAHNFRALRPVRHGDQGDKPRQSRELKAELQSLWKISSPWHLMPMGKGYYTLRFQSQEDKATAKANLLWNLSVGSLRLRDWVRYFNPYKESSSLAQVWVRIYYLPVEFWHPEIISGIGSWLGQPLKIDGNSMTEDVGHFVRMLVEIDLAQLLPMTLNIDGGDNEFSVEFSYEYIPIFCHRCKITDRNGTLSGRRWYKLRC